MYNLNDYTVTKMKAIAFHASVRLRLKGVGQIKSKEGGKDRIVGLKVRAQVVKNRMGPPLRAADFDIFFDRGIDNYGSWLTVMKDNNMVKQTGAWYTYIDTESGEEVKFQAKEFAKLLEDNVELREQLYAKICEVSVVKYKKKGELDELDPDELTEDSEITE
jgi:recombination protein RecA